MGNNSIKYMTFTVGAALVVLDEMYCESKTYLSILGLLLLVTGLYLISKGIGEKPSIDPFAVQSYDEEE